MIFSRILKIPFKICLLFKIYRKIIFHITYLVELFIIYMLDIKTVNTDLYI